MPHAAQQPDASTETDRNDPATVAPRRPGRAQTPPRAETPEWRARPDTLPNLFLDLFEVETDGDDLHPGRQRIAAAIRAREAAETPELLNIWHDAFAPETALPDDPEIANDTPPPAPDDLDRLRQVRDLLYAEMPDAPRAHGPSVQMRLAVHAMNGTLVAAAAPVGVAVMAYSILKGEDMRLTACAMIACGTVMAMLDFALPLI